MAVLTIITGADNPMLRTKTKPIEKVTKKLLKLIKDMGKTMEAAQGVGLAAPQVSESVQLCLVPINGKVTPLINPDITWKSKETAIDEEGCLSLPNIWLPVPRSVDIHLSYLDQEGKKQERKLSAFEARVVQHEVDHLNGVLIVDYITAAPKKVKVPATKK